MTGIAVGIAAVILMVAIGTATQKQVIDQIQNLGANVMMVVAGQRTGPGGVRLSGESNVDTGGEFISRRIDEPIRRMIGGIQDPSCCL
jgi:putative ABC transport system permease protein